MLLILRYQSHIWKNSWSKLWANMLSANQPPSFFKMKYLKKEVNDEVYFWGTDKPRNILQADTIILGVCNQVYPK